MQGEQERLVRRLGLAPEPRKYRAARDAGAVARDIIVGRRSISRRPRAVHVAQIHRAAFRALFSRDSVGGGPYVVEAAYPLGGADIQPPA